MAQTKRYRKTPGDGVKSSRGGKLPSAAIGKTIAGCCFLCGLAISVEAVRTEVGGEPVRRLEATGETAQITKEKADS